MQQTFTAGSRYLGVQFHPQWNATSGDRVDVCFGEESPLPRYLDEKNSLAWQRR